MKRVRMLLRVSSAQQLEANGDLSVQRAILMQFIEQHNDWVLDTKCPEYFEGDKSAYKNTAEQRDVLQSILEDAREKEFDILVPYKDDRVGRLLWDTTAYVMSLKSFGVDIYTVKDGCITPELDDLMGQVMLAFRYANAQKSSVDTGMRVKDTAKELVKNGKFMGGAAPYGYRLELSDQISKHGRILHKLVIVPEEAEVVKHIFSLSLNKEFGSTKIAKELNLDENYKNLAPRDNWKSGTITSILTNPVYAGYVAYKRRERVNGKYHRLDNDDWILATEPNEDIRIIDYDVWNRTQDKRKKRSDKYIKRKENDEARVIIRRNDGALPLLDVLHCGYCGRKMTNGSKYNYWTLKDTGERRTRKIPIYKCQDAQIGIPHNKTTRFKAEDIEPIVFDCLADYIDKLQENQDIFSEIELNQKKEKNHILADIKKEQSKLEKLLSEIKIMEAEIPNAITGNYPLTLDELMGYIRAKKEEADCQKQTIQQVETKLIQSNVTNNDWKELQKQLPSWKQIFKEADGQTKRVLVNKLVERIDVTKEQIVVRFKINLNDFISENNLTGGFEIEEPPISKPQPRMSDSLGVPKQRL